MNFKKFKSIDFGIGTIFLLFLIVLFSLVDRPTLIQEFIFGLFLLIIFAGFYMYIFTPEIVSQLQALLNSKTRLLVPPLSVSLLIVISQLFLAVTADIIVFFSNSVLILVFLLTPTILYLFFTPQPQRGLSIIDVIAGLWVWLPIEFGFLDSFLGFINLGNIPFQTLVALFSLIYAIIFVRKLDMGLTFTLSLSDLKLVNAITLIITLIILPLGILSYFLAPPQIILDNIVNILSSMPSSILTVILTFITIFLGIALIEEIFFRGFVHQLIFKKFQEVDSYLLWAYLGVIALAGLIAITPWIDDGLELLSQLLPFLTPIKDEVGVLARPLGEKEGVVWPLVQSLPLELLYLILAVILGITAFAIIYKTQDPLIAALILSSMLFGWAHFDDVRYVFFATVAGYGYGWTYSKTNKIVPAALIHMTIDAVWSLILNFP